MYSQCLSISGSLTTNRPCNTNGSLCYVVYASRTRNTTLGLHADLSVQCGPQSNFRDTKKNYANLDE